MLGPSILAAPVFSSGATERTLYLPAGADWYDWRNDQFYTGGQTITVAAPLAEIPTFIRAGGIVPAGPLKQYVEEPVPPLMDVDLYPSAGPETESFTIYEDDGISFDFRQGEFLRTLVTATSGASSWTVEVAEVEGSYVPEARPWTLRLHDTVAPSGVTLNGVGVAEVATEADLDTVANGWFYRTDESVLVVRFQSSSLPATVEAGSQAAELVRTRSRRRGRARR